MQNMTNAKILLAVFEDISDIGKFYLWNINWRKEAEMWISKTIVNLNETRHLKKKKNFPLETKNKILKSIWGLKMPQWANFAG